MRTFSEIQLDVSQATNTNDAEALLRYAAELDGIGTPQAVALASNSRGWALNLHDDYTAALGYYRRALAIHEELGSRSGVAGVTGSIGIMYFNTGDYPAALEHFHRALALHEELGNRKSVAGTTCNIGMVHEITGDYPAALEHFHRALTLCEEVGNRHFATNITGNIGNVHFNTGDYPAALEHFHRALALHEELGNRIGVAGVTGSIGNVHSSTGDYAAALEYYHRSLALYEELGSRSGVAAGTSGIGSVHSRTGDYAAALEYYHRALALYEELGSRNGVASAASDIVAAYLALGSDAEAQALLQAMDAMQIDDPRVRIDREGQRATLQERNGDFDGAAMTLQRALFEAQEHGLRSRAADAHKALRELALKQSDLAAYVEHNNEYTRITEEINGKEATLKLATQAKQREIDAVQREHAQHMAVLYSTLPKNIADRVARGEVVNDQYDNAAVIFLDIVGFTTISDRIPSGHVVHLLEQIFTNLDAVCLQHDVIKIKTIGDSYMAVSFESVINAASCALDMLTSLDALVITMPPELGDTAWTKDIGDIKVRIGMHCGPVTAGVIGTQRMQYDVWGDTVNVASRMESMSEPGRIHVSEALAAALSGSTTVMLTLRGETEVKGKGVMQTYWLGYPESYS